MIENIKICEKGQHPANDWEVGVMNNWNIRNLILDLKNPNPRESARWDCPPTNWLKLNFDGASKGNPGIAGYGVVIRNSIGDFFSHMAIPLGCQSNHVTKASATLYGLMLAKDLNLVNIWIEGDSLNIINCLKNTNPPSWTISNIIAKARKIINSFQNCFISHNYREVNGLADWASNVACGNDRKIIWDSFATLPADGHEFVKLDKWKSKQTCFNYDTVRELSF